jgi:Domain of unknown function (DUF4145)
VSEQKPEMKRIFCNNCNGETHHVLRAKYCRPRKVVLDEDGSVVDPGDVFAVRNSQDCKMHDFAEITTAIWSCAGCEEETFEWEYVETDPDGNRSRRYFPERLPEPENGPLSQRTFQKLDADLKRLYSEVITCFNNNCLLLCTLGLRVLLEAICAEKSVLGGNLEQKIQALARFIPNESLLQALHAFRFAGNAAAHELEALSQDDARIAIAVMEDLLNFLYELDYKASLMRYAEGRPAPKKQPLRLAKGGYVQ